MDELKDWRVLPDDIYVVTYPKSGTSWTKQIVKLIKSNGVDEVPTSSSSVAADEFMPWMEEAGMEKCLNIQPPRAFKSHSNYKMMPGPEPANSPAKYIYVVRNPKDTAVSLYHHTKGFKVYGFDGSWDFFFEHFLDGKVSHGLWFDHVLSWWKYKDADNILFLKYEDMKKDLPKAIEIIASFIGYKLEPQVMDSIAEQCSFQSMKENSACNYVNAPRWENSQPFIRKGVVGDWKSYFTEDQNRRFDELYTKRMSGTGLEFEFE
jgi:hypothetical protein